MLWTQPGKSSVGKRKSSGCSNSIRTFWKRGMYDRSYARKSEVFMEKQVVFFGACYYSGLTKLGRWLIQQAGPRLIILNYHRAAGGDLRRHMLYLRRHYRMLHLEEALEELYAPDEERARKQRRDRRTPLVLT